MVNDVRISNGELDRSAIWLSWRYLQNRTSDIQYLNIQSNLFSKYFKGHSKICTSYRRYLLSVLVDIVQMSWEVRKVCVVTEICANQGTYARSTVLQIIIFDASDKLSAW